MNDTCYLILYIIIPVYLPSYSKIHLIANLYFLFLLFTFLYWLHLPYLRIQSTIFINPRFQNNAKFTVRFFFPIRTSTEFISGLFVIVHTAYFAIKMFFICKITSNFQHIYKQKLKKVRIMCVINVCWNRNLINLYPSNDLMYNSLI